uniref:acid phosphatase n=1 Tax=Anisakis simplex TaxID=6269 RepID=A0A0M3J4Q8_ANISI
LIKDIIDHMDHKIRCMDSAYANKNDCSWMSKLKYYAYSSHWATIDALLTALETRDKILPVSLPGFTATFVIELWKTDAGGFSIRARYRDNPGDKFRSVTSSLPNCNADFCPYDEFKKPVKKYYVNDIVKLCNDVPADWKPTPKKAPETTKPVADENRTNPKLRVKRDVGNAGKKTEAQNDEQLIFIQAVSDSCSESLVR